VIGPAAAGLALLVAFVMIERRAPEPLLWLGLFSDRVVSLASIAGALIGAVLFGLTVYVPVYVQGVQGASAVSSGLVLIPWSLCWSLASAVSGQLVSRTGRYRWLPIFGSSLVLAGFLLLSQIDVDSSRTLLVLDLIVNGIGMGAMVQVYIVAAQNAVAPAQIGVTTAAPRGHRPRRPARRSRRDRADTTPRSGRARNRPQPAAAGRRAHSAVAAARNARRAGRGDALRVPGRDPARDRDAGSRVAVARTATTPHTGYTREKQ
jgi:hypothetical protein